MTPYLRWLWTQALPGIELLSAPGRLALRAAGDERQRAPSHVPECLMSDRMVHQGTISSNRGAAASCVSRRWGWSGPHAFSVGAECAAITHGHPCNSARAPSP